MRVDSSTEEAGLVSIQLDERLGNDKSIVEERLPMVTEYESLLNQTTAAGPVDEIAVLQAEQALGLQFPSDYRSFLRKYGAVAGKGFEVAGLFVHENEDEPPFWRNVVQDTLRFRAASRNSIPHAYVAISGDDGDYTYYLDTAQRKPDGECPVVAMGPGVDSVIVGNSFADFLVKLIKQEISF